MNQTIIIRDTQTKQHASNLVATMPHDPPHEVVIREHIKSRSDAQRRLQWLWNTEIGNYLGLSKNEAHYNMKEAYAVPIFTRDDKGYLQMVNAVKNVRRKGLNADADTLKRKIVELTSTTDFNIKQMSEYLHDMEMHAASIGCPLTFPEDTYEEAMKREIPKRQNKITG